MANNRLYLCAVDDSGNIKGKLFLAKHFGGAWYSCRYDNTALEDDINEFFELAFIDGLGIALKAEDMTTPTNAVWHYND